MTDAITNMYASAKTWSPFKGCEFACTYCAPSFQRQAKRQKHLCEQCYRYEPHCHENRLKSIPSAQIVFVCGNADISFCPPDFTRKIIKRVTEHSRRAPHKTFFFQSKQPAYFEPFLSLLPASAILLTTLETNRDKDYDKISQAPPPSERYRQFKALDYPRKVATVEPVLDFDVGVFSRWLIGLRPEYVWLGLNSKEASVQLPEPSEEKLRALVQKLKQAGVAIRGKTLRGLDLGL